MDLGLRIFISYHLINPELKRAFCKYDKKRGLDPGSNLGLVPLNLKL